MLGGKRVVDRRYARAAARGQPPQQIPVARDGAHHVAAAVEVHQRAGFVVCGWRTPERRDAAGIHFFERHLCRSGWGRGQQVMGVTQPAHAAPLVRRGKMGAPVEKQEEKTHEILTYLVG